MEHVATYPWPGNIRELENFVERAVIYRRAQPLNRLCTSSRQRRMRAAPVTLKDAERAHIARILRESDGVIGAAAIRLGVPRSTLFYKMRRLGITAARNTTSHARALGYAAHA